MVCMIDEKHRVFDVVFLTKLLQKLLVNTVVVVV